MEDNHHRQIDFHFRARGIFFMGLFKMISGYLMYKQGHYTKTTLNPLMRDYKMAEQNITQGIQMTERRSKKLEELIHKIKVITVLTIMLLFVQILQARSYVVDEGKRFISYYYQDVLNGTNI